MKKAKILSTLMAIAVAAAPALGYTNSVVNNAISGTQLTAFAGWKQDSTGWWYENSDGSYPANKFVWIGGEKFWFNSAGYMHTGWLNQNGIWYYCNPGRGNCAIGWKVIDGKQYCFNSTGQMRVGFQQIGGKKYYFENRVPASNANYGKMLKGFFQVKGKTYYAFEDGHLALNGWYRINNRWYYFNADGSYNPNKRR